MSNQYQIPSVSEVVRSLRNIQFRQADDTDVYLSITPSGWRVQVYSVPADFQVSAALDAAATREEVELLAENLIDRVYEAMEQREAV
jgi:hypothetical protein